MTKQRVLFLGGTGYTGGAILHHILSAPSFPSDLIEVTALVRKDAQADNLKQHYPSLHTIIGTLDDASLLTAEAARADIVVQAADSDHENANDALMAGLVSKKEVNGKSKGTILLLSGAACFFDLGPNFEPGAGSDKVWSDVDDMEEIWNLPKERIHVAIERKLVAEGEAGGVQTVILSPPNIASNEYGFGKKVSWNNVRIKAMKELGSGFVVGKGNNKMSWISTEDVADVAGLVLRDVIEGGGKIRFGKHGYYLVEAGEWDVGEMASVMADELHSMGLLKSSAVVNIDAARATVLHAWGPMLWGGEMRIRGDRVRIELGWTPKVQDWKPLIRNLLQRFGSESELMVGVLPKLI